MLDVLSLIWNYIIPFLVVLTALVFVHELGHYLAARKCGVRVEVFSVGFGRELFGWNDRHGTRWKLCMIPFGGYVKMFGEMQVFNATDEDSGETGRPRITPDEAGVAFDTKPLRQRSLIVAAGPLANFLLAIVLLSGMFMTIGQPFTPADIGRVLPNSAAERAGLLAGDVIVSIDGRQVERFEEVIRTVRLYPATSLELVIERGGDTVILTAIPDVVDETDRFGNPQRIGRLGVLRAGSDMKLVRHDPLSAVWRATAETYILSESIFSAIWQIIRGTRTTKELGGPIRIAQMSGDVWQTGLISVLMFAVVLSINLGLINLFPVPMLDGGHLLFYAIEALRGRPVGERAQNFGVRIGIGMVFALMVFATWNDLVQLRVVDFFVGLVT